MTGVQTYALPISSLLHVAHQIRVYLRELACILRFIQSYIQTLVAVYAWVKRSELSHMYEIWRRQHTQKKLWQRPVYCCVTSRLNDTSSSVWEMRILIVAVLRVEFVPTAWYKTPSGQLSRVIVVCFSSSWSAIHFQQETDLDCRQVKHRHCVSTIVCAFTHRQGELNVHLFQKQAETWTHLTSAHSSTVFRTFWDELWPRELGGVSA